MEIRQLKYFLAVAERMHFTQAAQTLHVSQPALSQQIRLLEEEIGVKLLERTNRRVTLTPAGNAFRIRAEAALREAAEGAVDARLIERGEAGNISIGFVTPAAVVVLPRILDQFCNRFPQASVELRELDSPTQLEAIKENRIAVGFTTAPSGLPSLECRLLAREKFIVALPQGHPATKRRTIDLRHVANERFLLPPRGVLPGIHESIIEACHRAGFEPKVLAIQLAETAICLVAGNLGVALIPQSFRRIKISGVVYRALSHEPPTIDLYAIRRKNPDSPLANNFWSYVENLGR
jgi:DNA-binding transcriptional LysR family regulator